MVEHKDKFESFNWKQFQADSLLKIVKHHRANCNGDCDLSLYPLRHIYKDLVGRELKREEEVFF